MNEHDERLDAEFKNYVSKVYPGAPEKQVMELRRTFYAGCWTVAADFAAGGDLEGILKASHDECRRFYDMAQKDIMELEGRRAN